MVRLIDDAIVFSHACIPRAPHAPPQNNTKTPAARGRGWVMAKGDGREVGFHDGRCFLKFLKREQINNQTFIAFLNWD